ncbi:MAG: hypothetical protein IJ215_01550 [Clostridia bacterium]|nr:hypothetical protein [Clostridia bacterium]
MTNHEKIREFTNNVLPNLSESERDDLFLELLIDGKTFDAQRHAESVINEAIKKIPSPFTVMHLKLFLAEHYDIKATPFSSMQNYLDWLVKKGKLRECGYHHINIISKRNKVYEYVL